jgi:hypothetical protein
MPAGSNPGLHSQARPAFAGKNRRVNNPALRPRNPAMQKEMPDLRPAFLLPQNSKLHESHSNLVPP